MERSRGSRGTKGKPKTGRNFVALNALLRRPARFKHKTAPKGGSGNWRSLKEEV